MRSQDVDKQPNVIGENLKKGQKMLFFIQGTESQNHFFAIMVYYTIRQLETIGRSLISQF